ncbi:MAG TPA: AraC family transcriptional regulator [Verrucomicrobiae bacterium]|nr:AraC family transcriptional regulator [Verrucomicrobiae bacterium]
MKSLAPPPPIFAATEEIRRADTCAKFKAAAARRELQVRAVGHRSYAGRKLPSRVLPEIPSLGWWNARHDQSWGEDWHRHEGVELAFLSRGRLDLGVGGRMFHLRPGDMVITRPWQKHKIGDPTVRASHFQWLLIDVGAQRPNERWRWPAWLVLSRRDRELLTTLLRQNEHPVWRANARVRDAFLGLMASLDTGDLPAMESRIKIATNALLASVLDLLRSRRVPLRETLTSTRRTVELFLESIDERLDHQWTLDEMAARCGLGRSRFAHHCGEITNLTPAHFLLRRRLGSAARLLCARPHQSITGIAIAAGFQSSQYFANRFRLEFGCTPSEYRRRRGPRPNGGPRH